MTTKIKDGLFISDSDFSQDMDFLSSNKITYVINCAGNEVSNRFERTGIRYLTLHWNRSSSELFDNKDAIAKKIYLHVEKALCSNQCCLIHSIDGVNRAVICTTIYLMCKYGWPSSQSLQFLQILKPEIRPCQFYIRQLESFEDRVDQLRSTFPKTRCNYGDDEQLLLNTYNNIIKARQIMPNMTLLKYNKYNKYQEDDENNGGGSGNDNRRIQWFGPLIRPATPSYISVSEDLTLISVYRRNLHNKKLEEPLKSNIKDQIYVSPISEPKPKIKPPSTTNSNNESKTESTLRKTSSTSSLSKISMTPINTRNSIYDETKSPLPSPPANLTTRTKNVFITEKTSNTSNTSNTPNTNTSTSVSLSSSNNNNNNNNGNNEMKYSSKYSNLYYSGSNNNNSISSSKSPSISSSSISSSSNNSSTVRNLASRPSSSAYSCSYNNNNNNLNNNNNTTTVTYRFITRPSSTTPQSNNNNNNNTPSPPVRPSSAPPKKTPPPLFIKHSVRKELMNAYNPVPSPLTTPDSAQQQQQQQREPVVMYKSSMSRDSNIINNSSSSSRQVHPPPPKFFNYKSPVQHATLPTNSARTMRETVPVKEYPIAKNALQEGRRISLPPRLDDETIRPDALTATLQTTGTSLKLRSNTPQPKHTTIKKDKKVFHTTDTVQAWTSRTRRPTPMKKGHTSTIIRSYVKIAKKPDESVLQEQIKQLKQLCKFYYDKSKTLEKENQQMKLEGQKIQNALKSKEIECNVLKTTIVNGADQLKKLQAENEELRRYISQNGDITKNIPREPSFF